ncbi:glycosyltransferase [Paraburkholderia sp. BCC1876]|uniref:glycosyltransferase n=1 Tax=Paraburkholderia sp. BCC1876 TaxID=2676303 RepID=UPI0015929186|nr:glycosyltransferase [Paraburkholderia sp. BCC1876]
MMKILFNALVLGKRPAGYTTVIREYLRALNEGDGGGGRDVKLYVLIQRPALQNVDPDHELEKNGLIHFIIFPKLSTPIRVLLEQVATNFFALKHRCDLIHCPATLGTVFPLKPQLLFFHTSTTFMLPRRMHGRGAVATKLTNWIIRRSAVSSRQVAVTTRTTGSELEQYVGSTLPLTVVGCGVSTLSDQESEVSPAVAEIGRTPFILYVSSFYRLKNQKLLIETAARLKGMQVVLAGSPAQSDYFDECAELIKRLDAPVHIVGTINDATLAYLYQKCKVYVCPSLFEGFALTPLEALRFDKPVLLARSSVLTEVYGAGFRYFDSNSPVELVDAIESVDDAYREFCTRHPVLQKYDWKTFAQANLRLYDRVVQRDDAATAGTLL